MRELIKNTFRIGATEVALIIVGILKNKYLAVQIGPSGYGMYSLLDSFFGFFLILTGGWLSQPTMKYIAELRSKDDKNAIRSTLNFSFSIAFFAALFLIALFFIFSRFFLKNFLSSEVPFTYFSLLAAAFLGTSLSSIMQPYYQGMLLVKETVFRRITVRLFDLISVVILVLLFGLTGFFINVLVVAFFGLFIYIYKSSDIKPKIVFPNLKNPDNKKFLSFGGISLYMGAFSMLSLYLQRLIILSNSNLSVLGLFRAASTFINYIAIFATAAMFFVSSKASEIKSPEERNLQLNNYIKMSCVLSIIIFIPSILFSDPILKFLYSNEFSGLSPILFIFIISQYFINVQYGIAANAVGLEKYRLYAVVSFIAYVIIILIPLLFFSQYGLITLGFASIIASFEQTLILSIYLRKHNNIGFSVHSILLSISGLLLICTSVLLLQSTFVWRLLYCAAAIVIVYFLLSSSDKIYLMNEIKNRMTKKGGDDNS